MKALFSKSTMAVGAAAAMLSLGASAACAEAPAWCGPKKASIAFLDGFGGNSWRVITTASAKEEALKCPSITQYEYADGQGNTQKVISDIKEHGRSRHRRACRVWRCWPGSAASVDGAFHKAGKVVVPYRVVVGGEAGKNYSKYIGASEKEDGVSWANWIKSILPSGGNVLFISGPAGNSQGLSELEGLKSVLGPEYKFINPAPFDVTNWDPALTQQVLTAEIAKNPKIDVIVSDFGPSLVGALPVFKKFNRSIPPIATSDGNILGCFWTDNHADNPDFKLFTGGDRQRQRAPRCAMGGSAGDRRDAPEGGSLCGSSLRGFGVGQAEYGSVPQGSSWRHLPVGPNEGRGPGQADQ